MFVLACALGQAVGFDFAQSKSELLVSSWSQFLGASGVWRVCEFTQDLKFQVRVLKETVEIEGGWEGEW